MLRDKNFPKTVPPLPNQKPVFRPAVNTTNVMFALLIILALFSGYLFLKVNNLEKNLTNLQPKPNLLSVENLKKYAKELGLNTGKFNKCLDAGEKKALVDADENYGASLGVKGTPGFFVNGRFFAGAFSFEFFKEVIDKELAGTATDNCNDYSDALKKLCEVRQNKVFSDPNKGFDPSPQKIDLGKAPSEGVSNPKVTIVEFSDFECPYCARAYTTLKQIMKEYNGKVKLFYKQYPLPPRMHPYAEKAAEASLCALDQGQDKFWKFHNKLFDLQSQTGN